MMVPVLERVLTERNEILKECVVENARYFNTGVVYVYVNYTQDYINAGFGYCTYCGRVSLGNICTMCSGEIGRGRNVFKEGKWTYPGTHREENTPLKMTHDGFVYRC